VLSRRVLLLLPHLLDPSRRVNQKYLLPSPSLLWSVNMYLKLLMRGVTVVMRKRGRRRIGEKTIRLRRRRKRRGRGGGGGKGRGRGEMEAIAEEPVSIPANTIEVADSGGMCI